MTCQDFREMFGPYLRGGLLEQSALALEAHAANCPRCEALLMEGTEPACQRLRALLAAEPQPQLLERVVAAVSAGAGATSEACQAVAPLLSGRVDGALTRWEKRQIALHLRGCSGCRALAADLRRVDASARMAVNSTPSAELLDRILARVPGVEHGSVPRGLVSHWALVMGQWRALRPAAALAAAAAVVAGIWVVSSLHRAGPRGVVALVPRARMAESVVGPVADRQPSAGSHPLRESSRAGGTSGSASENRERLRMATPARGAVAIRSLASLSLQPSGTLAYSAGPTSRPRVASMEMAGAVREGTSAAFSRPSAPSEMVAVLQRADFSSPVVDEAAQDRDVVVSSRPHRRESEPILLVSLDAAGRGFSPASGIPYSPDRRPEEAAAPASEPLPGGEVAFGDLRTLGPRARIEEGAWLH